MAELHPPFPCPRVQLWLLADWVVSEGGRTVRRPLAAELVRLVDAVISSEWSREWLCWASLSSERRATVAMMLGAESLLVWPTGVGITPAHPTPAHP